MILRTIDVELKRGELKHSEFHSLYTMHQLKSYSSSGTACPLLLKKRLSTLSMLGSHFYTVQRHRSL